MESNFEKVSVSERVADFVTSVRFVLVAVAVALVVVVAVFGTAVAVTEKNNEKGLADVDSIAYTMTKDSANLSDAELEDRRAVALKSLASYVVKGGVVGVRADMLAAEIEFSRKNYEEAAKNWLLAAKKSKKAYTAPLSYFNAAVAYEDAGNLDEAENLYRKAAEFKSFDQAAHAKFSLGRVLESKGNAAEAKKVYEELFNSNPDDSWGKLAETKCITLSVEE